MKIKDMLKTIFGGIILGLCLVVFVTLLVCSCVPRNDTKSRRSSATTEQPAKPEERFKEVFEQKYWDGKWGHIMSNVYIILSTINLKMFLSLSIIFIFSPAIPRYRG